MGTADVIPPRIPTGYQEIVDYYGDPQPQIIGGKWVVSQKWESASMATIRHPILPTTPCPDCGAAQPGKLYVHRLIAQPLTAVFDAWRDMQRQGDPYRLFHVGCFAPRAQRGSNGLVPSLHTFGIAWDVNEHANKMIYPIELDDPRRRTAKDLPDTWIDAAKRLGAFWGGEFTHRFDPMHTQFARGM